MKYCTLFFLLFLAACERHSHVTLLYFNDAHEIAPVSDAFGERGGVARLKTIVDDVKKENPNTLIVFGGDLAGGTLFGGLYHGFPMVEAFNKMPIDIANFGQHDFDFGVDITRQLVDSSDFQWCTSNLLEPDSSTLHNLPACIIKHTGDIVIAFICLTDAMNTTSHNNIIQLDVVDAASHALLEIEHADVIIAVTQTDLATNEKLLLACPQIDVVLTEERSENRTKIDYVGDRPIISPCGTMGSVVRLDLSKHDNPVSIKISVIPVDSAVPEQPDLLALQNAYQDDLQDKLADVIAFTKAPFDAGINSDFRGRWGETTIGNLIANAFREYYQADMAVINGGGVRANIPAGVITAKELLAVLPFGNKVCLVEMAGREIIRMLEHGVSNVENHGGELLHISGGRYIYDWTAKPGERIENVFVQGQKIEPGQTYSLALPNYILLGGNDFKIIDSATILVNPDDAPLDVVVLRDYIQNDTLSYSLEGRIGILNKE